jgi:hypothetical protein
MRKIALVSAAVMAMMAFASVSSASALSWTPQSTKTTIKGASDLQLVTETGIVSECSNPTAPAWSGTALGANMNFSNVVLSCKGGISAPKFPEAVKVTLAGNWSETATSTSAVTLNATPVPGTVVMTISFPFWAPCEMWVRGPVSSTGATWSNSNHTLTLNNSFPVENHAENYACKETIGKKVWLKGTLIHDSSVSILP